MRTTVLLAAAISLAVPTLASASPVNATDFAATVEHDDLDLTTPEGAARLDARVNTRINQLCKNGSRDSASIRLERQCRKSALAAAKGKVRVAVSQARSKGPLLALNMKAGAMAENSPRRV